MVSTEQTNFEPARPGLHPLPSVGSPSDVSPVPGEDVPFWLPDWRDSMRYMGWRWILLLIPAAVVGLLALSWYYGIGLSVALWYPFIKIIIIVCAIPVGLFFKMTKDAVSQRREAFCIHCGYELEGLPDKYNCPECGRPYTWAVIEEYRRDPHWFIRRWKTQHELPMGFAPFPAGPGKRARSRDGT